MNLYKAACMLLVALFGLTTIHATNWWKSKDTKLAEAKAQNKVTEAECDRKIAEAKAEAKK